MWGSVCEVYSPDAEQDKNCDCNNDNKENDNLDENNE